MCPLDVRVRESFEHTVRTCDLTPLKKQSLPKDPKLAELHAEYEHSNCFLDPTYSGTNHVHRIMANAKHKRGNKKSQLRDLSLTKAGEADSAKRLQHDYE